MHVIAQFSTICSSNSAYTTNNTKNSLKIHTTYPSNDNHGLCNNITRKTPSNRAVTNIFSIPHDPTPSKTKIISSSLLTFEPSFPTPKTLPPPISPSPNYYPTLNPIQRLAASTLDMVEKSLILDHEKLHPLRKRVDPAIQLSGNYAPVQESPVQKGLEVIGEIPHGLHGVYVRNGANPSLPPSGAHHLFDGDGMIHAVNLGPGNEATYCCRFTRTNRFVREKSVGKNLFPKPVGELHGRSGLIRLGLFYARAAIGLVDPTRGIGAANAGIVYFNGRLLAMSEDDLPYHVQIIGGDDGGGVDLETVGRNDFDGQVNCPLIAHPKLDPNTSDLHTLSYDVIHKPYLKYFKFDKHGQKTREVPVPLSQPTMIHDFAITQNFIVIPDNQVVFKLFEMVQGGSPLTFDSKKKARFGILSKDDTTGSGVQWIEVPNSFCFHFMNAWEENEGDIVNIIGSCMSPPDSIFNESDDPTQMELCEIRLDLKTGKSTRRVIIPNLNLEIGQVNKHMIGVKTRYVYMAIAEPWPKCSGIAKVDVVTSKMTKYTFGHERYGGEPCFVPAKKPSTQNNKNNNNNNFDDQFIGDECEDEDEGWILNFVRDENVNRSELVILRAKDMKQIACVNMPSRVPYGFHGTFVDHNELNVQKNY